MTDFRALCADLVKQLEGWQCYASPDGPNAQVLDRARAALSQPTDEELKPLVQQALEQPEPEVLADEEWEALKDRLLDRRKTVGYQGEVFIYDRDFDVALDDVRQELDRYARPAIKPVPVSERLPGPEDCDEEGRCWLRGNVEGDWRLVDPANTGVPQLKYCFSHWLPHHALPVPAPSSEEN